MFVTKKGKVLHYYKSMSYAAFTPIERMASLLCCQWRRKAPELMEEFH
jgi:hypothetical protein